MEENSPLGHRDHQPTVWLNQEQEPAVHNPPDEVFLLEMQFAFVETHLPVAAVSAVDRIAIDSITYFEFHSNTDTLSESNNFV